MDLGTCLCPKCEPPSRALKRQRRRRVGDASASEAAEPALVCSLAVAPGASEPLFVLERLAHIRFFTLTVSSGSAELRLSEATLATSGSEIDFRCTYELAPGPEADGSIASAFAPAVLPPTDVTRLVLDTAEALEEVVMRCDVSDGYAYARVAIKSDDGDDGGGGGGDGGGGGGGEAAPRTRDSGLVGSKKLRDESGLYRRAAEQRRLERSSLTDCALICGACASPLLDVGGARALPCPDASSLVDFMQCCEVKLTLELTPNS